MMELGELGPQDRQLFKRYAALGHEIRVERRSHGGWRVNIDLYRYPLPLARSLARRELQEA